MNGRFAMRLPKTVYVLGLAALLNDAASEMVAPLLPTFITGALGATPLIVGVIEGMAEAAAGTLRLLGGALLDRGVPAGRLVRGGYALSNLGRPLLAATLAWPFVLFLRLVDRLGKGLRSAPRDALIAASVRPAERGLAFGVQRSLDHTGAVIGPLLAAGLLALGVSVRAVFAWSAIPGAILLFMLWRALPAGASAPAQSRPSLQWGALDGRLWGLLAAATLLSFAAVPEAFLMVWARLHGIPIIGLPLLWAATSVVKMTVAIPAGVFADRWGRLPVLAVAWLARVSALLALANPVVTGWSALGIVLLYGGSLAVAEPAERALVADAAPEEHRGSLYGAYYLLSGLGVLPGAIAFGAIWSSIGPTIAFQLAAGVSAVAAVSLFIARAWLPARVD
jgi:MFS family permease